MSTRFTALTIKEGDAFLLEDNGWNCLFDSGIDGKVVDLLKFKGIDKLDLAICSHNDADHAKGFIALLNSSIKIDEIWLPYWWASILQYSNNHSIDWNKVQDVMKKIEESKDHNIDSEPLFSEEHEPASDDDFNAVLSTLAESYRKKQHAKLKDDLRRHIKRQINDKTIRGILNNTLKRYKKKYRDLFDREITDIIKQEISNKIRSGLNEIISEELSEELSEVIFSGFIDEIAHEIVRIIADERFDERFDEKVDEKVGSIISKCFYLHDSNHVICKILESSIVPIIESILESRINEYTAQDIAQDITDGITHNIIDIITDGIAKDLGKYLTQRINCLPRYGSIDDFYLYSVHDLKQECYSFFLQIDKKSTTKTKSEESPIIKFNNIMEIAVLAHNHNCKIKWFEPTRKFNSYQIYSNFVALNSTLKHQIQHIKNTEAFAMCLYLSKENEYSLIFEYCKNGIPIIRFSADSDLTCQSRLPYPENIIVTAPHHGSSHNAIVYNNLDGDDIIWVRSDTVTGGTGNKPRPCDAFKSMKNKYCLACKSFNFISEISFEYDPWHKKWQHIRGEQCRCKPLKIGSSSLITSKKKQ